LSLDFYFKRPVKKRKKIRPVETIGRRELISFPDLDLNDLIAKIDTGANTTALHCHDVRVENGVLFFRPLDPQHPYYTGQEFRFEKFEQKIIRSSFGEEENRYIIRSRIRIGTRTIRSIISLTDRKNMKYPVLIGRRLLQKRFLVDVSLLNALSKPVIE
jgi:hypothetical protein